VGKVEDIHAVSKESTQRQAVHSPTFLDLFCGCGGFTLGMIRSGFHCVAAIDFDRVAIDTLRSNLDGGDSRSPRIDQILHADLTKLQPEELARRIDSQRVDVIVGGPPCQGFSTARQVDGANHGARIKRDARRYLYRDFLRFVDHFQPKIFVMENVLGLRSAGGGEYFTRVQKEARCLGVSADQPGYRVHAQVEDAYELGSPQKRRRQLIVGVRADLNGYFIPELRIPSRAVRHPNLGLAILDLPILRAGGGSVEREYDLARRTKHVVRYGAPARKYLHKVLEISRAGMLTNHAARPHSPRDLRDFARLREGEHATTAMKKRGVRFEFPYDKSIFKDRYTRQSRSRPCSTIVAHLSKDGLMFIHPTQNRSLTPREAARVQTFPDWYRFPASRTSAFRLIGNAVPPVVGEAVGNALVSFLRPMASGRSSSRPPVSVSFRAKMQQQVAVLSQMNTKTLRSVSRDAFLAGWYSLLFLMPQLHPESALDHGPTKENWAEWKDVLPDLAGRRHRRYRRSGWPVALAGIAREAWRRLNCGLLTKDDFYAAEVTEPITEQKAESHTA
jgi:DNA (cytosine-5)-methyltransferase 1